MSSITHQQVAPMFMSAMQTFVVRFVIRIRVASSDDLTPDEIRAIEEFENADDIESIALDDLLEELKVE